MADILKQTSEVIMKLDPNALETMVKEQLRVQIAAVLAGGAPQLVERLVKETLDAKVTEDGRRSTYDYENKSTFISAVCRNAIKEAVAEAVNEWRDANKASIKAKVKSHLSKHKDQVLDRFAEQTAEAIGRTMLYPHNVQISIPERS
jgi:hypothetical protein